MKAHLFRRIFTTCFILMMAAGLLVSGAWAESSAGDAPGSPVVIAYYFHGNYRCHTCLTLERLSKEAIYEKFSKELKSGRLVFRSLNVDEAQNRHFIDDFGLYSKSLVLVKMQGDKEAGHKNLEKIWTLWRDEPAFKKYVQDEIAAFMK